MKRFKRRRRATQWIANTSTFGTANGDLAGFAKINLDSGANPVGQATACFPVLCGDQPFVTSTIMEERKNYTIRRIVGRSHMELNGLCGSDGSLIFSPLPVYVRHGFIVLDVDEVGNPERTPAPFLETTPVTFGAQDFTLDNWLWIDSFPMGNNDVSGKAESGGLVPMAKWYGRTWPGNNQWGAIDHTKIDVKTARRINNDQRLFYVVAVAPIAPVEQDFHDAKTSVTVYYDVRTLISWGSTQRPSGRRR